MFLVFNQFIIPGQPFLLTISFAFQLFLLCNRIFLQFPCFAFQLFLLRNRICFNQTKQAQFRLTTIYQTASLAVTASSFWVTVFLAVLAVRMINFTAILAINNKTFFILFYTRLFPLLNCFFLQFPCSAFLLSYLGGWLTTAIFQKCPGFYRPLNLKNGRCKPPP